MPIQRSLASDEAVTLHNVAIDHKFVHIENGHSYLLSAICSVHLQEEHGGGEFMILYVPLYLAFFWLLSVIIPGEFWGGIVIFIVLPGLLLLIAWCSQYDKYSVKIGTPYGRRHLVSFYFLKFRDSKQKIAYGKAKQVTDALMSQIG